MNQEKGKSALFCSIEKGGGGKEGGRKRERQTQTDSYLSECMTENLKQTESQGFA